jgi:indolepyruvate decarboxylase
MHYLNGAQGLARISTTHWRETGMQAEPASLIDTLWQRICQAKLPLFWAGPEIRQQRLCGLLQQLVDASAMPFGAGMQAHSPSRQPHASLRHANLAAQPARALLQASDCVMVLGTVDSDAYLDIMAEQYALMIEINTVQARIGYAQYDTVPLEPFLSALLRRFEQGGYVAKTVLLAA